MIKQKTRAELIVDNEALTMVCNQRDEKIDRLERELNVSDQRAQNILNTIIESLDCVHLLQLPDYRRNPFHNEQKKPSLQEVQFKIGQLLIYSQEYLELKDRMLPLEKSKVLESENQIQHHNGNPGIGNIEIGRV